MYANLKNRSGRYRIPGIKRVGGDNCVADVCNDLTAVGGVAADRCRPGREQGLQVREGPPRTRVPADGVTQGGWLAF